MAWLRITGSYFGMNSYTPVKHCYKPTFHLNERPEFL